MKARRARSPHLLPPGLPLYAILPATRDGLFRWVLWDSRATEENHAEMVTPHQGTCATREAAQAAALALAPDAERIGEDHARRCHDGKRPGWAYCGRAASPRWFATERDLRTFVRAELASMDSQPIAYASNVIDMRAWLASRLRAKPAQVRS